MDLRKQACNHPCHGRENGASSCFGRSVLSKKIRSVAAAIDRLCKPCAPPARKDGRHEVHPTISYHGLPSPSVLLEEIRHLALLKKKRL